MNSLKLATALSLALGAAAMVATPANAQRSRNQQQQPSGPQLSREESALIVPLDTAIRAQNWAEANTALQAAQAGVQSAYGRYVLGTRMLQLGQGTQNQQLQAQAVEAMIASGAAPAETMPNLIVARARFAIQARDWPTAERYLTQALQATPNDADRLWQLAEVQIQLNKNAEALATYQRLLQAVEAAGQTPTEERVKRALEIANALRQRQASIELTQRLLRSYPTQANWTEALVRFRALMPDETNLALDVRRFMRTAQAFARPGDYLEFAGRLTRAGQPGEVKAVLEEGASRGTLPAGDADARQMLTSANARITEDRAGLPALRTRAMAAATGREARIAGDTFYGYGQYADAVALYRAALQKGGEDANLVNTRLGAALVAAGQRAEAQAAFRAVTGGDRAALAALWLLWLERPAA
jgi:Tfp pilus assembly protein PilF